MSRQRRNASATSHFATTARGAARDRLQDAGSKELAQLAKKLGNDRVQGMLQQATGKRDALLEFVRGRLVQVKVAQQAELRSMSKHRVWFDEVARGKTGFKLPDPTRWRGPALLYKRAIQALCAGDLGRGAQLLEKAVEAERAAFESMPAQVQVPSSTTKPAGAPDESAFIESGETCPPTEASQALAAADDIIKVSDQAPLQAMPRNPRQHRGWWDVEVEDDAEKKKAKKPEDAKEVAARAEGPAAERAADEKRREETRPAVEEEAPAPEKARRRSKKP